MRKARGQCKSVVDISEQRVLRITLALGAIGTVAVLARYGVRDALGFLVGAGLSYLSFRSWVRLAATIGDSGKAPRDRFSDLSGAALCADRRSDLCYDRRFGKHSGGADRGIAGLLRSFGSRTPMGCGGPKIIHLWQQNTSLQ